MIASASLALFFNIIEGRIIRPYFETWQDNINPAYYGIHYKPFGICLGISCVIVGILLIIISKNNRRSSLKT